MDVVSLKLGEVEVRCHLEGSRGRCSRIDILGDTPLPIIIPGEFAGYYFREAVREANSGRVDLPSPTIEQDVATLIVAHILGSGRAAELSGAGWQ